MNVIRLLLLVTIVPASFLHAQTIRYEDAVTRFAGHGLAHRLAEIHAGIRQDEAILSTLYPDPVFHYTTERIRGSGETERETAVTVEQELEVLRQPALRRTMASRQIEEADLQLAFTRSRLLRDFTLLFLRVQFNQDKYALLQWTYETIDTAYLSAVGRFEEGALSGFELQRFSIERLQHQKEVYEQLSRLRDSKMRLLTQIQGEETRELLSHETIDNYTFSGPLETVVPSFEYKQQEAEALFNRNDLKALEQRRRYSQSSISLQRRNRFPRLHLEYGYKEVSSLGHGYEGGLSLRLPLFNTNKRNISISEAEGRGADLVYLQKEREITVELSGIFSRLESLKIEEDLLLRQLVETSLLDTAVIMYGEGAISLVELLDAVAAHVQYELLNLQFILALNETLTDLRFVTGTLLVQP